jgi:hypothetical protein
MHVSNSHPERSARPPAPVTEPTPSGAPELPVAATLATDGYRGRPAHSARYVVEHTSSFAPTGSADEADARLILEMRYQEYQARRAVEEIFESGEAEILSL